LGRTQRGVLFGTRREGPVWLHYEGNLGGKKKKTVGTSGITTLVGVRGSKDRQGKRALPWGRRTTWQYDKGGFKNLVIVLGKRGHRNMHVGEFGREGESVAGYIVARNYW